MTTAPDRSVRRAAAGLLAGTLAVTGGALVAGMPANAVEGFAFERLSGADRYDTAARIATDTFDAATTAVIASGAEGNFPDALAGNYLAGAEEAPILLTMPTSLPDATADALEQLGVEDVVIVGGTAAVSAGVENELRRLGYTVRRLGGSDRYATGALVVDDTAQDQANLGDDPAGDRTAVLGSGQGFADILAAGPIAYSELFPLLLTRPSDLPDSTARLLEELDIERVVIVGGPSAVSTSVEDEVEGIVGAGSVDRVSGTDRFGTAAELAELSYDELGFDDTHVNLARGDAFADALAGGPHAGRERAPIVTTFPGSLPAPTQDLLEERSATLEDGHIFGGPSAVSSAVEARAEDAAEGDTPRPSPSPSGSPSPTGLQVTPDSAQTLNAIANVDNTATDDRTYSVTGLAANEEYRITLVRAENVTFNSNGKAVFAEDGSTGLAATGSPTADITSVNGGAPQNNSGDGTARSTNTTNASPTAVFVAGSNGQATFVVDGDATPESIRPVVYRNGGGSNSSDDGGNSPRLNLNDDNTAADESDVGGTTTFQAPPVANAAASIRPELTRAEIVSTVTQQQSTTGTNPPARGTTVRYVFDEEVTGTRAGGPDESKFFVYDFDGTKPAAVTTATIESTQNSVLVRFQDIDTPDEALRLRLATVDLGAVTDNEGSESPIGDAPLGTAGTTTTTFQPGVTLAPDLQSVGNFRSSAAMLPLNPDDPGNFTTVEFTFDERAFTTTPAGFHLVLFDGSTRDCTAVAGAAGGRGTAAEGDTTIDASCDERLTSTGAANNISPDQVARAYVDPGTVSDDSASTSEGEGDGRANALQATQNPDGNSSNPDLTSAELQFSAPGAADSQDIVVYTFDEPVTIADAAPSGTPATDADGDGGREDFTAYTERGQSVPPITAVSVQRSSTNANQVIARFADGALDEAVGASVRAGAVASQVNTAGRQNNADEVGVSNSNTATRGQAAGFTADPDLTSVRTQTDAAGQQQVAYVFDEDLGTGQPVTGKFTLLQSDGTRLICDGSGAATRGSTDETDNIVVCSRFVFAAADGTPSQVVASAAQIRNAVAGAVDDDAVISRDAAGTATDFGNPEGAELLTGSTGSAQQ